MNLLEHIKTYFHKPEITTEIPKGYCPNCWGRQEYSGKLYDAVKVEEINTNNLEAKKGWIQAYAEKYLTGIQLKSKNEQFVCNSCQTAYKNVTT